VSRAVTYRHADWLSLVEPGGSFLTLPVLNRVFPDGLERVDPTTRQDVRDHLPPDFSDRAAVTTFIEWVLSDLLKWGTRVRSGPSVPSTLSVMGERGAVLRPDYVLASPAAPSDSQAKEQVRALVCAWPTGTDFDAKVPQSTWSATPAERMARLCHATGVGLGLVTDGAAWQLIWAPLDGVPGNATFMATLFSEEPAILDAFVSLLSAKRFFAVAARDTIEALLTESASAQEVVADQLGRQVRSAVELLVASISRANRERGGELLDGLDETTIYAGSLNVLMRLVFLFFAEERSLLPIDDDLYARAYAASTLRDQLQAERDLHGEEPLERRSSAWYRLLALFRAVHGGLHHDDFLITPYGGRLFDPDRFPFLEGRKVGTTWRTVQAHPIPVDDLTMLEILTRLQVLEISDGGIREARQLTYRTLEVEQIGHVYEGLLDHSVRRVDEVVLGLIGKPGDEPEVTLSFLEGAAADGRPSLTKKLQELTGLSEKAATKLLDGLRGDTDHQLLAAAVDNDDSLVARILPFVHLVRRDIRQLPIVMLPGSVYVTQTSTRREGGVEYTTRDLADEVAEYALQPLVYSPGPQDAVEPADWRLRPASELLDLKICDPAVGSGAILVAAGRYLAKRMVEAWESEGAPEALGSPNDVLLTALRAVADGCLYGCDRDPLAAEMAKMSLWLTTMARDRPFTFLDHAIRVGDSLLGVTDLEQIRWMDLDPAEGKRVHHTIFDYTANLEPLVKDALRRRLELKSISVMELRDAQEKERLTIEADHDLEILRAIGDLLVGASLSMASKRPADLDTRLVSAAHHVAGALGAGLEPDQRASLVAALREQASAWLNAGRPPNAAPRRCLHWPLEFPEVFIDRDVPGFDAMVGNPPFIGGKKIVSAMGEDFRDYMVHWLAGDKRGHADLVAYFYLRAISVTKSFGFLGTNTIAQGDTSEVGLSQMIDRGWTITRADSSAPWPGRASLEIAKVWATGGPWVGPSILDGHRVSFIDEMLYPAPRSRWRKQRLDANADQSFIGSFVLGAGFVMSPDEAQELIESNSRNREVLFPYLGGEDVNQSPTQTAQRWVINFFDWPEERARSYEECFALIEEKVKPERQERGPNGAFKKRSPLPQRYWIYADKRPKLYASIADFQRVLVITLHSKPVLPVFADASQVFTHGTAVFAYDDDFHFGVLTSGFHYRWALRYSSTLETRIRYTPSDVFDTFAQPPQSDPIATTGRALNDHRSELMIAENEGLTATYNRVHDPDDSAPGIVRLRELHVELDLAVRDTYGWRELDLGHGFHQVRGQGTRFTFAPPAATEILQRLLELNQARYGAEVKAGLHRAPSKKPTSRSKKVGDTNPTLFGSAPYASNEAP
jgi:hypothetical protein